MKNPALILLIATFLAPASHAISVTNIIDDFNTFQLVTTNNATVTNTVTSPGSIGGYRTLILSTSGGSTNVNTFLGVDNTSQQFLLNTPPNATPSFDMLWAGAGGTNGLGGFDFGAGQPLDLSTSVLSFGLSSTDQPKDFTWTFTDIANNVATYTGNFPAWSATNPPLTFNIALSSFTNAGSVNWNAINTINFSGGDASSVDMTAPAPFQVVASTVPEPGTWALLATGLTLATLAVRRKAKGLR
jgi:hypothetical protein